MSHFRSMTDYHEAMCEQGKHEWSSALCLSETMCAHCDAQRCHHREIVYGVSHCCENAMAEGSEAGLCEEHDRESNQEQARQYLKDFRSEETQAGARATMGVLLQVVANLMLGAATVEECDRQHQQGFSESIAVAA